MNQYKDIISQNKHCYHCKNLKWICRVEDNNVYYDVWDCPSLENKNKNMGADCNNFMRSDIHIHKYLRDKLNESKIL